MDDNKVQTGLNVCLVEDESGNIEVTERSVEGGGADLEVSPELTRKVGFWLRREGGDKLEVFTDSLYGPNGCDSQGCVIVKFGGDTIMWKSGKQSVPSLSTAESELGEAIEGLTMGDSIDVLVQEMS